MQKAIGIICIVIGALLFIWGHNIAQSVGSQVQQVFTGEPTDRAMHLYIGGAVLAVLGVALIFWPMKRR